MNQPPLRRRRRQGDAPHRENRADVLPEISPPADNTELLSDDAPERQTMNVSTSTTQLKLDADAVERIRTELLEDRYHTQLSESEYWDETHHWGEENELVSQVSQVSDDYWHFPRNV